MYGDKFDYFACPDHPDCPSELVASEERQSITYDLPEPAGSNDLASCNIVLKAAESTPDSVTIIILN